MLTCPLCAGSTFWLKCKVSTTFLSNALQFLGSFINSLMLKCYSFKSKRFTADSRPNTNLGLEKFCPTPLEFLCDTMGFLAASSCCVVLSPAAHSRLLSRGAGNSSQQCKFTTLVGMCMYVCRRYNF